MERTQERIDPKPQRRVLVIDDEDYFCQYMSRLVSSLGFKVTATSELRSADFVQLTPSDLIFIDMNMPEADGIQTLELLSRNQVKAAIVLMSGAHSDLLVTAETIAKRSGLRVVGMLNKPFRNRDIRRILEEQHPPLQSASSRQLSEIDIEDVLAGLERQEFDVFFQPIVKLSTGLPTGFEALARWRSEKFSLVSPKRFISVAARNGVLPRLTHQIVHKALGYASALKERGHVWNVSVNLGAEDLLDERLPEKLASLVVNHNLPPGSLTVELTESSATVDENTMLGILARIRLKGIGLAIDDFGTSYSSLQRLSIVPFTSLKIDMRFITDMMTNMNARTIVESSIALAKRLKMTTVAEGIETKTQLAVLRNLECDLGQGYLFARPMEFNKLVEWLSSVDTPSKETLRSLVTRFFRN